MNLRQIARWCAAHIPFLSLIFVGTEVGAELAAPVHTLKYRVDMSDLSIDRNERSLEGQTCDPGNYKDDPALDFPFEINIPPEQVDKPIFVKVGIIHRSTTVHLNRPVPLNTRFELADTVTVKYPVVPARIYELKAVGILHAERVDVQLNLRRIDQKQPKHRYCTVRFRLKNKQ